MAFDLTGANGPERAPSLRITANFFRTLGVQPVLGRDLLDAEDQPGGRAVVLRIASATLAGRFADQSSQERRSSCSACSRQTVTPVGISRITAPIRFPLVLKA